MLYRLAATSSKHLMGVNRAAKGALRLDFVRNMSKGEGAAPPMRFVSVGVSGG